MIKRTRYSVEPLPVIPEGSEFKINGKFARIENNDILFLYDHHSKSWYSSEMSLDKYSTYWDKTLDEYTLHEFIQRVWGSSYVRKNMYFFYNPSKKSFETSYNSPVKKGTVIRDGKEFDVMKAGETRSICQKSYPQIVAMIELFGDISLYEFEDKVRSSYEHDVLSKGETLPQYNQKERYYYVDYVMPDHNILFQNFCDQYFYGILGIELCKDD